MKLLLDTHALIWHFLDSPWRPADLKATIDNPAATIFVSAATAWEIATKYRIGRCRDCRRRRCGPRPMAAI